MAGNCRTNLAVELPPELLLRIMQQYKSELQDRDAEDFHAWRLYPWSPSQVCRYWRDVLTFSPMEWTQILLNPPRDSQPNELNLQCELARCRLQMERSKDLPLHIVLNCVDDHPAISYIYQESHRWKEIVIDGMVLKSSSFASVLERCTRLEALTLGISTEHIGTFQTNTPFILPLLRHFVSVAQFDHDDQPLCSFRAPALEELEIRTEIAIETLELFMRESLPHNLTTLSLIDIMLTTTDKPLMESCLQSCPQLTKLTMWLPVGDAGFTLHMMLVILTWEAGSMFSPHLSVLGLLDADMGTEGTRLAFLEMLASRSEAAARAGGFTSDAEEGSSPGAQEYLGSWPKCFLDDVEITLTDEVAQADVFDDEQLTRIRELSGFMTFSMTGGATWD